MNNSKSDRLARWLGITTPLVLAVGLVTVGDLSVVWPSRSNSASESLTLAVHHGAKKWRRVAANPSSVGQPLQSELSRSLEQDELRDENPFARLSTHQPLHEIMNKGVVHFKRDTYRSSHYKDEAGYDLISYDVEHLDGSHSTILAYLETPKDPAAAAERTADDPRLTFVAFMVANGPASSYSFFRGGQLVEQSDLTLSEAESLINQRLAQGLPFLSVSR